MTYWTGGTRAGKSYLTAELLRAQRESRDRTLSPSGWLAGIRIITGELDDIDELLRPAPPAPPVDHDAERRANLAVGLLMSVTPSDRALAGWGIEPEQVRAVIALASRPPDDDDDED